MVRIEGTPTGVTRHRFRARVTRKVWGPDDEYLVIPIGDIQVFEEDGFKEGDEVAIKVEIEKCSP